MFYKKITQFELDLMKKDDGSPPNYTYEDYIINRNEKTGEIIEEYYTNLTIHMTADEAYEKWLADKENPPMLKPNEMEVLKARVDELENINAGLLLENAEYEIKIQEQEKINKDQEVTNANLLLELAILKGEII